MGVLGRLLLITETWISISAFEQIAPNLYCQLNENSKKLTLLVKSLRSCPCLLSYPFHAWYSPSQEEKYSINYVNRKLEEFTIYILIIRGYPCISEILIYSLLLSQFRSIYLPFSLSNEIDFHDQSLLYNSGLVNLFS